MQEIRAQRVPILLVIYIFNCLKTMCIYVNKYLRALSTNVTDRLTQILAYFKHKYIRPRETNTSKYRCSSLVFNEHPEDAVLTFVPPHQPHALCYV